MKLAVLIDAENVSPEIADGLFMEIAKIGEANVRRIYGDFSAERSRGWSAKLAKHAIAPQQQFSNVSKKNASDIALVIDAMDLLNSGRFDGFCIVSSDSDFTRLASRIREQGLKVFGFGEQKTPIALQHACHRFIFLETPAVKKQAPPAANVNQPVTPKKPKEAIPLLTQAAALAAAKDGWADVSSVGLQLSKLAPKFAAKSFGFRKLSDLIRGTGSFEVTGQGKQLRVRPKPKQISVQATQP